MIRVGRVKIRLDHMFLHHTDSFYIAQLNTTVHFDGWNGAAYTRPFIVRNKDDRILAKRTAEYGTK